MSIELLEIDLLVDKKIVTETLNRIGIANKKKKILYPSCYIYEIEDKYYLVHFKEMFVLTRDDAYVNISEDDKLRKNAIAFCLKQWGLIDVANDVIEPHNKFVFVLPYGEKQDWHTSHKFNFKSVEDLSLNVELL